MEPPNLPGYYWDGSRKKYFKIAETATSAPHGAEYSATAIGKRKAEQEAGNREKRLAAEARLQIRLNPAIRPEASPRELWTATAATGARALSQDFVTASLLRRSLGVGSQLASEENTFRLAADAAATSWAGGLAERGTHVFQPGRWNRSRSVSNLPALVAFEDGGGNYDTVVSTYNCCPIVDTGYISLDSGCPNTKNKGKSAIPFVVNAKNVLCAHATSMRTSPTASTIHMAGMSTLTQCSTVAVMPKSGFDFSAVGSEQPVEYVSLPERPSHVRVDGTVYASVPAPSASSSASCVMGTSHGIAVWRPAHRAADWILTADDCNQERRLSAMSILDVAIHASHPELVYAGARCGLLFLADLRAPLRQWQVIRHNSAIAKLRPLRGDTQIVVAGCESSMAVYDMRFPGPGGGAAVSHAPGNGAHGTRSGPDAALPIVSFAEYKNVERTDLGFDVEPTLGVAAAANEDGTIGLYSVRSGRRLPSGDVTQLGGGPPIKALTFATSAGDSLASLFVGIGLGVKKYGLARPELEGEEK